MDRCNSGYLENIIEYSWAIFGFAVAAWAHVAFACGAFHVQPFDGALMLLQPLYSARGLTPYRDFGFTYPPGAAWFLGDLLRCRDISQVLIATAVLNFVLVSISAYLIARLSNRRKWVAIGSVYFCLGWLVPATEMRFSGDLCSISLTCIAALLLVTALSRRRLNAFSISLMAAATITTLWRMDRLILSVLVLLSFAGMAFVFGLIPAPESRRLRCIARRIVTISSLALVGILVAGAIMALVSVSNGSFHAWLDFVFQQPAVVLPYRKLAIPRPVDENAQWLCNCIALVLLIVAACLSSAAARRRPSYVSVSTGMVLLAVPLSLLPYTFHRADFVHFLPLSAAVMTSSLAGLAVWKSVNVHRLLVLAIVLVIFPGFKGAIEQGLLQGLIPRTGVMSEEMIGLTNDCSALIPADAQTIFVGQKSYRHFLVNMPIFYLANLNLRPATAFIAEEPGIENSCKYGSQIAADLERARRPTAVLLDEYPWHYEPNLSSNIHDCGKISAELTALRLKSIGECKIGPRVFGVGIVR